MSPLYPFTSNPSYDFVTTLRLVVLNVVVADKRHPDQRSGSQAEGEELRETESHGLEDEKLTGKVAKGNNVGPVSKSVDRTNVKVVSGVASNNAGDKSPSAEESTSEGSKLVGGLGVVLSRNQLVGLVFGFEGLGLGGKLGVADESTVVDSSGKVQGGVRLQRVADGDNGELYGQHLTL